VGGAKGAGKNDWNRGGGGGGENLMHRKPRTDVKGTIGRKRGVPTVALRERGRCIMVNKYPKNSKGVVERSQEDGVL